MERVLGPIDRALGLIDRVFLTLASLMLVAMLAGNTANIAIRNLLGTSLPFIFSWTVLLFVWMCFLGFYVMYRRGRDIRVEFFIDRLGPRGQRAAEFLAHLAVLAVTTTIAIEGPGVLALQVGPISEDIEIERYVLSVPLFVSVALVWTDAVIRLLRLIGGKPVPPHPLPMEPE